MYYEEQWVDGALCWRTSPTGAWTRYTANELAHRYESAEKRAADAQATVEALQAIIKQMGEQACVLAKDGMAAKAQVEALQRERDEWRSNAVAQEARANDLERDCKDLLSDIDGERAKVGDLLKKIAYWEKRHSTYRELAEENMNLKSDELSALQGLVRALQQEREKVKGLEDEGVKLFEWRLALHSLTPGGSEFCTPDACESWVRKIRTSQHEYIIEQIKQRKVLQSQLSQLQALVRALPVVRIDLNGAYHDTLLAQPEDEAVKELLRYRASLDATTPNSNQLGAINDMVSKGGDGE